MVKQRISLANFTFCVVLVIFLTHNSSSQVTINHILNAQNVQIFNLPPPAGSYYPATDINNVTKPLYAESFTNNRSFPNFASDIYGPAGPQTNCFFGGDNPSGLGFGFTSTSVLTYQNFSSQDFPIILEGNFFNRSSFGDYNESYLWVGNADYPYFCPGTSILPSANVQEGIIIGALPNRTIVSNGKNSSLPSTFLFDLQHNLASYNNWYNLKAVLNVTNNNELVIEQIILNGICILTPPIVIGQDSYLDLSNLKFAIVIDDFGKDFNITTNLLFEPLEDKIICVGKGIDLHVNTSDLLCTNYTYSWDLPGSNILTSNLLNPTNIIYSNEGIYESSLTITGPYGVKVLYFEVLVYGLPPINETISICQNDSIFFNNQWIKSSGIYEEVLTYTDSCQRSSFLNVTVIDNIINNYNIHLCQGDSVRINGNWVYDQGQIIVQSTTIEGCDSLSVFTIDLIPPSFAFDTLHLCQGDSLLINGNWVYDQGQITVQSNTIDGCDSISVFTIELIPTSFVFDTLHLCQGDSISINGSWYFDEQTIFYVDNNSFCPINISTTILGNPSYSFLNEVTICRNDSIFFNDEWINSSGLYKEIHTSQYGCDSIFNLNLSLIDTLRFMSVVEICQGDSTLINGTWVYDEGEVSVVSTTINGCDSVSVFSIVLIPIAYMSDTFNLCQGDSLLVNGSWYNEEQTVSYVDNNSFCPTHISATIIEKPNYTFLNEVNICSNDSIFFNNQWINSSGTYQELYTSQHGCDSIYNLNLSMLDTLLTTSIVELCQGDSIFINGIWVYDEGDISVYSTSINGCDSIFVYSIDIVPTSFVLDTFNLCQGDSILVNGSWYFDGQTISYIDQNSFCPTNISATIIGKPRYTFMDEANICPNDSILYQGHWISSDGAFLFEYKTQSGCDSLYFLNTYLISEPDLPTSEIDCQQLRHELSVPRDTAWSIQWSNGSSANSTFYTHENEGTVSYIHLEEECRVTYFFDLIQIPTENEIPIFGNTEVLPCEPLKINLSVDSTNWTVDWYQNGALMCENCLNTLLNSSNGSNIEVVFQHISGCDYIRNFSIGSENTRGIYIPNIFWPQSTSGNDKWRIHIPECYHIEVVKIYDRWGNLVSIMNKPQVIEWDGIYKGENLEQGVYTYVIHFTDDQNKQNIVGGDVTLIR